MILKGGAFPRLPQGHHQLSSVCTWRLQVIQGNLTKAESLNYPRKFGKCSNIALITPQMLLVLSNYFGEDLKTEYIHN